ncbi:diguanylate cyclase domain-containing protein [Propylenella binzhouense]|uniref:Diguanylate cyclase n=1 Tax=Propylenella binzhouense TaxID=2555902 RepID=A0A964T5Q8_9HYPH|nr:diguanylate cyclase [Propylenella binzhouense]MYZ49021.1 diguanylate cyclase [Propylenella binzhouense]
MSDAPCSATVAPYLDDRRPPAAPSRPAGRRFRDSDHAEIERLRAEIAAQAEIIRSQAESLAHSRKIFERASAAARIGVWECRLADETLSWSDVVYDIFDLPRGSAIDRRTALACYPEESRLALDKLRRRAIEERGGFGMDAEIVTAKGNRRWIRITATVECEGGVPVRIFGMKQDITEEKILADRTRYLAEFDVMTGLANRSTFQARLAGQAPAEAGPVGALLLVDLDGFKQINDTFGHAFGDACLKEAARRLAEVAQTADLVARIGGDEFAIVAGEGFDLGACEALASAIVETMRRPVACCGHLVRLGASVGIASAAGRGAPELFMEADIALYAAKAAGRDTFRTFVAAMMPERPRAVA